jgi:GMP synthase-like glutamine amidotransferase
MSAPSGRALFLQHGASCPPALLADWARERGIAYQVHRVDLDPAGLPELDGQRFIASLGSDRSPNERDLPEVAAELELLERAVARGIPVLGLCYGGQALAAVLGGRVERAPEPELGWARINSQAPELVAEGPWLQWHYDRFTLPPGAQELASNERALQAFARGPHLGVQFHPESTVEIVRNWAREDARRLAELGIGAGGELADAGEEQITAARTAAFGLFDAFLTRERGDR